MDSNSDRRPSLADMFGAGSAGSSSSSPPKRRMTMAEMLRESPLVAGTVALPDAVESAQENAARKAAAAESGAEPPAAVAPADQSPAAAPAEQRPAVPVNGVHRYHLYAKMQGKWVWQCDVSAATHAEALTQAGAWLKPEHENSPIRLEQDEGVQTG